MSFIDYIWEWAYHGEWEFVNSVYSLGDALELLSSDPEEQIEIVRGNCPFIEAWYGSCWDIKKFIPKLSNHSLGKYYNQDLLISLNYLAEAFGLLSEQECREGKTKIFYLEGWGEIRKRSKVSISLIEWDLLKTYRADLNEML